MACFFLHDFLSIASLNVRGPNNDIKYSSKSTYLDRSIDDVIIVLTRIFPSGFAYLLRLLHELDIRIFIES